MVKIRIFGQVPKFLIAWFLDTGVVLNSLLLSRAQYTTGNLNSSLIQS